MANKCLECSAKFHCCINGFAFVGIQDTKKIKKSIGKEYGEFLDYSKLSKHVLNLLKNGDPSLESTLRFSLVNNDKILRIKKKDGKCFFLENGKCAIYKVRPKICRIYPYWCVKLINGRVKVIKHDPDSICLIRNLDAVTKNEETNIKKIFNEIVKEAKHYKKNITNFVKNNNL